MRTAVAFAVSALVVSGSPLAGQQRRVINEQDLLKFVWIADPQVSPDASQIVYVRVVVNEKADDYETSLWIVPSDGHDAPRPLTMGTRDSSPRFSPDGKRLAFVRGPAGQPPQIHLISLAGGEAAALTEMPRGAGSPAWSPDGMKIAFSSTTKSEDFEKKPDAPKSDVRVITSAVYRSNGSGWDDPERPSHLWVIDAAPGSPSPKARALTAGKYDEAGQGWSPDGSRVYFTSTREDESYYRQSKVELFSVPASGGEITKVASLNGTIAAVKPSPDGHRLAFVGIVNGTPERSFDQPDLFVANADGSGAPRNLTAAYDFDINGSVGGDQAAPRGGRPAGPIWSADGRTLLVVAGEQGNARLIKVDVSNGAVSRVSTGDQTMQAYSISPNGRLLAAVISTQTTVGDLFTFDLSAITPAPKQITRVNEPLFSALHLSEPEAVSWTSFDGKRIEGWLMKPPDFDPSKTYPFVLEIHGGPHSAYGNVFTHEFQLLAAHGYVVLFANPRGSSNYGQDFGNVIQFHYPGDDYKDLMAGVDEIVKRPYIDRTRLGVTGGSGGGLLTNWTVTHTTRFAAAVSQRDIADWYGFWFTADFSQYTASWFRKAPWEDPADFAARSPITHVANVKTPMLFVLGDDDLRTPPADGGEMMFRALKYMHVPAVMVRFPGETHELSRSGKPSHRVERLRHIAGWMDKWLQGRADLYSESTK